MKLRRRKRVTRMYGVTLELGTVDLESLSTDEDFRREAKRLLPNVLVEIGKALAETKWSEFQKAKGLKAPEKRKFIQEAGQEFQRAADAAQKRDVEDLIIHQLRERFGT